MDEIGKWPSSWFMHQWYFHCGCVWLQVAADMAYLGLSSGAFQCRFYEVLLNRFWRHLLESFFLLPFQRRPVMWVTSLPHSGSTQTSQWKPELSLSPPSSPLHSLTYAKPRLWTNPSNERSQAVRCTANEELWTRLGMTKSGTQR